MNTGNTLDRERVQWVLSQSDGRHLRLSRPPPPSVCGASLFCMRARVVSFLRECFASVFSSLFSRFRIVFSTPGLRTL